MSNNISFADLQSGIAKSYFEAAQKVYGAGRVSLSQSGEAIAIEGDESTSFMQHLAQSENKPINLYEGVRKWVVDKGVAYNKIPYVRKESEKRKPKLTLEERGLQSLSSKIAHKMEQEGVSLSKAQNLDAAFAQEQEKITQQIQEQISQMITNK